MDIGANIHSPLGKVTFDDTLILKNLKSLMTVLVEKKPPTIKGKYFIEAFIKNTIGPAWQLNIKEIDPTSPQYILGTY